MEKAVAGETHAAHPPLLRADSRDAGLHRIAREMSSASRNSRLHFHGVLVQKRAMNDEAPGHSSHPDPGSGRGSGSGLASASQAKDEARDGARLDALAERLRSARADSKPKPVKIHSHSGVDMVFRLVGGLVSPILIGVAAGWGVDRFFGLSPLGILLGTFAGLGLGFYVLVAQAKAGAVGASRGDMDGG